MISSFFKKHSLEFLSTVLLFAFLITTLGIAPGYSQTATTCTSTPPPVDTSHPLFRAGGYYWVQFDRTITSTQRTQIMSALSSWNNANNSNYSGVFFSDRDTTSETGADGVVYFTNASLGTGQQGTVSREGYTANPDGTISQMTLTFNTGATVDGQPGSPPYYDPTQDGYNTVFLKNALHGLGHGMGLNDATIPQTPGASVMNNAVANCPNDNCNNEPTSVTGCDNSSVNRVPNYAPPPPGDGGGDGGGTGGGGGGSGNEFCVPQYVEGECGYDGECDEWDPYTATCRAYPGYDYCLPGTWIDCP